MVVVVAHSWAQLSKTAAFAGNNEKKNQKRMVHPENPELRN